MLISVCVVFVCVLNVVQDKGNCCHSFSETSRLQTSYVGLRAFGCRNKGGLGGVSMTF